MIKARLLCDACLIRSRQFAFQEVQSAVSLILMSSAAAVAANAALSPTQKSIGEDGGQPSPVTSLSGSMDEVDLKNGDLDIDNSEDDIKGTARRRGLTGEATIDGQEDEEDKDELEDLFGDESEEPKKRQLDDQELDSGDDMDRADRAVEGLQTDDEETETQERLVMDLEIARQPLPEPSDGEVSMRMYRSCVAY